MDKYVNNLWKFEEEKGENYCMKQDALSRINELPKRQKLLIVDDERGIVDIETLTATNKTLISTLDEVLKIQEDGRAKRRSAEQELVRIEEEMRQKLLTVSRSGRSANA